MNDGMGEYIASEVVKLMISKDVKVKNSKILVLGITFKENCPDIRNTKVVDVIKELESYGLKVVVYDPYANPEEVKDEYNIHIVNEMPTEKFDGIVLAVAHDKFKGINLDKLTNEPSVIYDVKGVLEKYDKRL